MKYSVSASRFRFLAFAVVAAFLAFALHGAFAAEKSTFLKVSFLEVGQGDCELIRTPSGKVIMIDAGDDTEYAAENYIIPYLEANGIKKIDTLIISHAHRDHIGGLLALIPKFEFGEVYENSPSVSQIYGDIMGQFKKKGVPVKKLWAGDKLDLGDGIETAVLHPSREFAAAEKKGNAPAADGTKARPLFTDDSTVTRKPKTDSSAPAAEEEGNLNNLSIVLRMQYKNTVYFFSGDAEKEAEASFLASAPDSMFPATVYKAAHHGSSTSSTPAYLAKLKPQLSIISCGKDNKFKHPHAVTVKNLEFYSKLYYRTDNDQTVETWTDGSEFHYSCSSTPNALVSGPETTSLTPYSATIEWQTTHASTSKIKYSEASAAQQVKQFGEFVLNHKITLTGLKPDTSYNFEIESAAQKDSTQVVTAAGSFKTSAAIAGGVAVESITYKPAQAIILEPVSLTVKVKGAPEKARVTLYEDAIAEKNIYSFGEKIGANGVANFKWLPKQSKHYELFAVVHDVDRIYAVSSVIVEVIRRKIIIDEAHLNIMRGNFENMKIDLYNRGFEVVHNAERITAASLKGASVLVIPEFSTTEAGLNQAEYNAIKKFVDAGGSLLLIARCDFGNTYPETLNKVLEQVGSNIRVNDDEVLDPTNSPPGGNMAYLLFMHLFDNRVISPDVKLILCKASCSMLNSRMKPITAADKTIIPLCYGDDDTYNIDADKTGDGVIYPKGTAVVVDAGETLPSGGRVAVFGATHVGSSVYTYSPSQQTQIYNYNVINWLAHPAKKREVAELSEEVTHITETAGELVEDDGTVNQSAVISTSIRADKVSTKLLEQFDYAGGKIEASTDNFLKYFENTKPANLNAFSDVIKKVLDRVRYETVENPQLMGTMKDRINALEALYQRSMKRR